MRTRLALSALALTTAVAVAGTAGLTAPATAAGPDPVRQGLETLLRSDGAPGALASVSDGTHHRTYTAGEGDRNTHAKVPRDGQVRIGSITKTFTAVVVLQLVAEGKVALDERVEAYLPGLVRGKGIDGNDITVRQLLQHTSGLPDYEADVTEDILERRYLSPRDALDTALRHESVYTPGEPRGWAYSNTNYLVAGLIVEKVTRRPLAEVFEARIIRPLGLRHTYFPSPGETALRGRHPQGYRADASGEPRNVTEIDPSAAWSAGAMVSTGSDLDAFFAALLDGRHRLLPEAQLTAMRTTVPVGDPDNAYGYGLGILRVRLSDTCTVWGHSGGIPGYGTWAGATDDGRSASVTMTLEPTSRQPVKHLEEVMAAGVCR